HGGGANVGVAADAAKLVHRRGKTDGGEVFDDDMACQRGSVHKQRVVAYAAVVPNVGRGQKEIAIADRGDSTALCGAAIDRYVFAECILVADDEFGVFAAKAEVL